MPKPIKYTCSCCGKEHEEWPALVYISPANYDHLGGEEKKTIGHIDTDFCTINYPDETARYIRCTLTQKVIDHCEDLHYGLWASLSEKSFEDYLGNFGNESPETMYFGWLSNRLLEYNFDESIPTTVFTRKGNLRPEIVPHEGFDHPFVKDYYNGITKIEAERRIEAMLKSVAEQKRQVRQKNRGGRSNSINKNRIKK